MTVCIYVHTDTHTYHTVEFPSNDQSSQATIPLLRSEQNRTNYLRSSHTVSCLHLSPNDAYVLRRYVVIMVFCPYNLSAYTHPRTQSKRRPYSHIHTHTHTYRERGRKTRHSNTHAHTHTHKHGNRHPHSEVHAYTQTFICGNERTHSDTHTRTRTQTHAHACAHTDTEPPYYVGCRFSVEHIPSV